MIRQLARIASFIVVLLLIPQGTAFAQDDSRTFDTIVVTAQKREQTLFEVPMGITAIRGEELKARGIESIQDLSLAVPGLTTREDGPGQYTVFLRGIANLDGSGALVSLFLDEAPLTVGGNAQMSPVALDFERVEVLKGPQGTLYGNGAAGGAIRYITNKPRLDRIESKVEASAYDVDEGSAGGKATGIFNVPIIRDELGFRIAASYEGGGGWIDQPEAGIKDGNDTELLNARTKLLWRPTDRFEGEAMIQLQRAETELGMGYEEPDRTVDVGVDRSKRLIPKEFDYTLYNLNLQYDFGFAELVGITTYIDHSENAPFSYIPREGNFSFGFIEGNDDRFVDAEQFSQEVRLSSSGTESFDWTVGAYYSDAEGSLLADFETLFAEDGDIHEGGGVFIDNRYYYSNSTSESVSLFADVAYHLTDRFVVGTGARYFRSRQSFLQEDLPDTGERQSDTFTSVDPRLHVSYRYADQANAYINLAKGFRSGGFNRQPFGSYDPEKVYTAEIGTRGAALNGRFQFELAGFYNLYDDMQRRRLIVFEDNLVGVVSNIAEAEVKGVELGLAIQPVEVLTLSATAAYLDAEIEKTDPDDPVNIAGDPVDYTPEWSFTLGANYEFQWTTAVPGYLRADFNYRDEVTLTDRSSFVPEALPQASESLGLLNARIGATLGGIGLELYGLNLTNQNKWIDPFNGWANANRTRPRVIGIRTSFTF